MLAKAARGTPRNARLLRKVWAVIAMELAFFVGVLLVGTGLWGEIAALSTLYVGSELGQRGPVLVTTVILFFAASAGPLQSALAATIAESAGHPQIRHWTISRSATRSRPTFLKMTRLRVGGA